MSDDCRTIATVHLDQVDVLAALRVDECGTRPRPDVYGEWEGPADNSSSVLRGPGGTVLARNLFTNPDFMRTSGEVVVWENRSLPFTASGWVPVRGTKTNQGGGVVRLSATSSGTSFNDLRLGTATPARVDTKLGESASLRFQVRSNALTKMGVFSFYVDPTGAIQRSEQVHGIPISDSWTDVEIPTDDGTAELPKMAFYVGNDGAFQAGDWLEVRHASYGIAPDYFDESHSPDPDLTPRARVGGGSELVGQGVAGVTANNGVAVRSARWAKSAGGSLRYINTSGPGTSRVNIAGVGAGETFTVWRYQDVEQLTAVTYPDYLRRLYLPDPGGSAYFPGVGAGESLGVLHRPAGGVGSTLSLWGSEGVGESVWFDLLTITDAPGYDGEPFSGTHP